MFPNGLISAEVKPFFFVESKKPFGIASKPYRIFNENDGFKSDGKINITRRIFRGETNENKNKSEQSGSLRAFDVQFPYFRFARRRAGPRAGQRHYGRLQRVRFSRFEKDSAEKLYFRFQAEPKQNAAPRNSAKSNAAIYGDR